MCNTEVRPDMLGWTPVITIINSSTKYPLAEARIKTRKECEDLIEYLTDAIKWLAKAEERRDE